MDALGGKYEAYEECAQAPIGEWCEGEGQSDEWEEWKYKDRLENADTAEKVLAEQARPAGPRRRQDPDSPPGRSRRDRAAPGLSGSARTDGPRGAGRRARRRPARPRRRRVGTPP